MTTYSDIITGTSGLTNYWRFEGNGTDSVGSATMTIATGYTTSSAAKDGNGLTANSTSTKTGCNTSGVSNTFFNNTYSIEVWFKVGQHRASQQVLARMSNDLSFEIDTSGRINYYYNGTQVTSSSAYDNDAWHHVVVTRDSSRLVTLYVDGTSVGTPFTANTNAPASGNLYVCGSQYTTQAFITGQMDEIALYNVALTPTQITTHYNGYMHGGYTAQAVTASAAFPGGQPTGFHGGYTAQAVTASAAMPDAGVSYSKSAAITIDSYTDSSNSSTNYGTNAALKASSGGPDQMIFIKLPSVTVDADEEIVSVKIRIHNSTFSDTTARLYTVDANWSESTITHTNKPAVTQFGTSPVEDFTYNELDITGHESAPYGIAIDITGSSFSFESSDASSNKPEVVYNVRTKAPVSVNPAADPMTADAVMVDPAIGIGKTLAADPLLASALMPNPIVVGERHADITAEDMEAQAEMPDAEFALTANATADVLEADAEIVDPDIETTVGTTYFADAMGATATWIKPALVNDEPIILDEAEDRYFQRVFALAPQVWQRLNDTGSTAVDRMGTYDGTYHGVIVGQHDGPDDRHSVNFPTVGTYLEQTEPSGTNADERWIQDGIALATTLEFSFRTAKPNTFLMAGADQTQTTQGAVSTYAARELFLVDGKIKFKSRIFAGTPDAVDKEFTGFRNLADGEWHHVVVKSGVYSRGEWGIEIWVDGTFEVRRFNANAFMGFPDYIGFRPDYIDGSELETLPLASGFVGDMTEVVFYNHNNLPSHDIARNYYALMGWVPIEAENFTAIATMPDNHEGRGNQKKALYLYWNPTDEVFQTGDPVPESISFDPMPGFVERAFQAPNVPFSHAERVGDYHGFKVFSRSVRVNTDNTAYRDIATDDQSLINLFNDVDIDDYDAIMFKDWPDEGDELDDINYNYPGQKDRLLTQLRQVNDLGIGLYVTNPRLAVDLGIVDDLEFVEPLTEAKYNPAQGNALGLYDYGSAVKFPWNIAASDGLTGGQYAAGIGITQDLSEPYLANKAYYYHDTNANNRFRVRAVIEGLTDIPSYMIKDAVFHVDYDIHGWSGVAYKYLHRDDGLLIGDEYVFYGSEEIDARWLTVTEKRYNRFNGTWATPPGHVKAGTIVTTFGSKHWLNQSEVDNPYKDYVTTIVLEPGDSLNGTSVGGRIFVNFSEQPSYGLGVAIQDIPEGSSGWPMGYNIETAAQREWDYSWTRTSLMNTSESSSQFINITMPDGSIQSVRVGGGSEALTMVRSNQVFPVTGQPRMEMTARGMYWLGAYEELDGTTVRATPMTATVESPNASVTAQRDGGFATSPMVALAQMPKVAEDETGDVEIRSLPMYAEATFTSYGKTVMVAPMTATAELVENFDLVHTTGEQVTLTLHNYEVTLHKEEA